MSDDKSNDDGNADESAPPRVFMKTTGQFSRDEGDSRLTTFRAQENYVPKKSDAEPEE